MNCTVPTSLRIALITDNYYPKTGGVEYCVDALARNLAALGHTVFIITRKRKNQPIEERKGLLVIKRMSYSEMWCTLSGVSRQHHSFFSSFDIIHAHSLGSILAIQALLLAKKIKKPHVVTSHSLYRGLDKRLIKGLALLLNHVICVSHAISENIKSLNHKAQTYYIPNGFDTVSPNGTDGLFSLTKQADELVIGTVSRLSTKKKVSEFILIAQHLLKHHKHLRFYIAGDGPQKKNLKQQADKLGISNHLIFTGNLSRAAVLSLLSQTDVFVLTSPHEAFGMVILEAIHHKVPIVACANNGISDFITSGINGFLASSRHEMIERITCLINNPELRAQIVNKAQPLLNQFNWDKVAEQTVSLYYKMLSFDHTICSKFIRNE